MAPKPTPPTPPKRIRYVDVCLPNANAKQKPSGPPGLSGQPSRFSTMSSRAMLKRSPSPSTFVPVSPGPGIYDLGRPPMSPYDVRKTTPSPALTAATADLSEGSFSSRTSVLLDPRLISPLTIYEGEVCTSASLSPTPRATPKLTGSSESVASASQQQRNNKSPFALQDDSERKRKIKTELCLHYTRGTTCPFGKDCVFAHSEEELRLTKLLDLVCAGMVDGETFRAKPCDSWVSTGSCPFGKRCACLHDKRVAGSTGSWLTHTETKGNSLQVDLDLNVETRYQQRLYGLLYSTPFGNQFSLQFGKADDLYNVVCNISDKESDRRCSIPAVHKVDIALKMRGSSDWGYIFKPQHIVHGELCMVLKKRAFLVVGAGVTEIPVPSYNPSSPGQVLVWELAFGPHGAEWGHASVRPVALYFNIKEEDVVTCSSTQAKRYRWKPNNKKAPKNDSNPELDRLESFIMIRPAEEDAFDLVTRILKCHLQELRAEAFPAPSLSKSAEALAAVMLEKSALRGIINCHIACWKRWAWPMNRGREQFDEETPVPAVDDDYNPSTVCSQHNITALIWESFLATDFDATGDIVSVNKKRLSIFKFLAHGHAISPNRNLPHITSNTTTASMSKRSELCWKFLLLKQAEGEVNEWELVREHFEKSRSKKVLTILQQ